MNDQTSNVRVVERSAEVKEHERRAAVILDGMHQFVALLNPSGDILEVNRAALEGVGHEIEEIRGKPFWTARWWQVSKQIQDNLKAAIRRAAAGEFVRYEVDIYGEQSGLTPITIDFSLQPIRGKSGEVEYLLPEGRNITERKRAEEKVQSSQAELRDFVENTNVGLHRVDADGMILSANQTELDLLGYAPEEYIGHLIARFQSLEQIKKIAVERRWDFPMMGILDAPAGACT